MKVTSLGHSCLLVETGAARILVDPGTFSDFDSLTDLDAVLITHQHADHLDVDRLPALLRANPHAALRADPGTVEVLAQHDDPAVAAAQVNTPGEPFSISDVRVEPVGEQHAVIHRWLPRIDNIGLVLRADGRSLFHPGDALDADPGPVEYLAVPVSAPWCAVKETLDFVRAVAPSQGVVPIHDALLQPMARTMYLKHIADFGLDGGVDVLDLADGEPHVLGE